MIKKLKKLISKNGFILFLLRFPSRALKNVLIKLNSLFWKFFLKECGNNVTIELGVNFENPKNIIIKNNVYIGKNSSFSSEILDGFLTIENNVHIGRNCKIDHTGNVLIKENCLLSENVKILSHSHGYDPRSEPVPKSLVINENCWFGLNTIITENCNLIVKNTIIATSSVVSKNILEENCIFAGIPSKKIKNY